MNKLTVLIIGTGTLLLGLIIGFSLGDQSEALVIQGSSLVETNESEHKETEVDEVISSDGVMQHMMDEMSRTLKGKSGAEFEESFLRGMIVHHLGAIDMAEELLNQTDRPELVNLANEIISTQTEEVETMKGWLEEWFKEN